MPLKHKNTKDYKREIVSQNKLVNFRVFVFLWQKMASSYMDNLILMM